MFRKNTILQNIIKKNNTKTLAMDIYSCDTKVYNVPVLIAVETLDCHKTEIITASARVMCLHKLLDTLGYLKKSSGLQTDTQSR